MSGSGGNEEPFEEREPRPRRPQSDERVQAEPSRPAPVDHGNDNDDSRRISREQFQGSMRRPGPLPGSNDALSSIIPYNNGQALAAYYLGVFSLIPCLGFALGIAALTMGILGLKHARRNPTAKGTGHAITGIVLGSLVLVAHLVIGLIIVISIVTHR